MNIVICILLYEYCYMYIVIESIGGLFKAEDTGKAEQGHTNC